MPQPQSSSDDIFAQWGIQPGSAPEQGTKKAQTKSAAPPVVANPNSDIFAQWQIGNTKPRVLVETKKGLVDRATGQRVLAKDATPDEIMNRVPEQSLGEKIGGAARATIQGIVNGVPIAGPSLVNVANSIAVAGRPGGMSREDAYNIIRERQQQDETANPISSFTGNLLGAAGSFGMAANAIPGAARVLGVTGPSMRARMAAGAASGGVIGVGDSVARNTDPLTGAAFGFAGGAAGPPIGALVGAGANKLVNAVNYVMPTNVSGASRPTANFLGEVISADDAPSVRANLARFGPQAMLVDAGPSLTTVGGGLATKPGDANSIVMNALRQRAGGANSRLTGDLQSSLGPAPVPSQIQENIRAAQISLSPQYDAVFSRARAVNTEPLANDLDASLANLRGPAQRAVREVRGYLNIPGTNQLDPNPRALFATREAIDGIIRTEVDDKVIRQLTMARQRVDAELARNVPAIKDVDAQFQELARQQEGLELGGRVLDSGKTAIRPQEMRQQFQEAAIPAGNLVGPSATPMRIQEGTRAEVDRLVGTKSNDLVALRDVLQGEGGWNTDKLSAVFGPERTNRLLGSVSREAQFADTTNTITRNSETARRVSAAKLLEDADPASTNLTGSTIGGLALQAVRNSVVNPFMKMIMQSNNEPMKVELARILTLQGPQRDAALQQIMNFVARQGATTSAARTAERIGSQGTNSLLLAAPVFGRQVESR